jgi:hypothetical protein
MFTGCGDQNQQSTAVANFEQDINLMCDTIASIDDKINSISFNYQNEDEYKDAKNTLVEQLTLLEEEFVAFSEMDFPTNYDYLEEMADEAGAYMTEAVNSYILMYADDSYTTEMEAYANENYARAYKRVDIILSLLRGETPNEEGLTIQ